MVRAGTDGADDLVRLRGGEDELDVFRRFFDDLEQGVEPGRRDHVGFVDDEDLVAVPDGGVGGPFPEVAGVVHTAVAGGVDLNDVQGAGAAAGKFHAAGALAARGVRGALGAVQAAGQDAGGGGFATAAGARKEIGVVDAVLAQGRHERLGDVLLPNNVRERIGAVSTVEGGSNSHR